MPDSQSSDKTNIIKALIERFKHWFTQADIKTLQLISSLLVLLLMITWPIPWNLFFHHVPEEVYPVRHGGFATLVGGLSWFSIVLIRKESPGSYRVTLRGKAAVLRSLPMTLILFGAGLYLLLCPV